MKLIKKIIAIGIILVIFLVVVLLFQQIRMHKTLTDSEAARKAGKPLPVNIYKVNKGLLKFDIPVEGILEANYIVPIYSISGKTERVKKTFVKIGDKVKKKQPLLQLDSKLVEIELDNAKKELKYLVKEVKERKIYMEWTQKNLKKGIGLERHYKERVIELVRAEGLVNKLRNKIKLKQFEIQEKYITAPVDGVIVEIAKSGNVAKANDKTTLVSISVINPIILKCKINEENLQFIKVKSPLEISFYSFPNRVFYSKISHIFPAENSEERVIVFTARLPNTYGKLLPKLHAIAHIKKQKKALKVPNIALLDSNFKTSQVFVVDSKQIVKIKQIKTGLSTEGYTEVTSGLRRGEQVVISGQLRLQNGDKVSIGTIQ